MPTVDQRLFASNINFLNACYQRIGLNTHEDIFSSEHKTLDGVNKDVDRLRAILKAPGYLGSIEIIKPTSKNGRYRVSMKSEDYKVLKEEILRTVRDAQKAQAKELTTAIDQYKKGLKSGNKHEQTAGIGAAGAVILAWGFGEKGKAGYRFDLSFNRDGEAAKEFASFLTDLGNPSHVVNNRGELYVTCKENPEKHLLSKLLNAESKAEAESFIRKYHEEQRYKPHLTIDQKLTVEPTVNKLLSLARQASQQARVSRMPNEERREILTKFSAIESSLKQYGKQDPLAVAKFTDKDLLVVKSLLIRNTKPRRSAMAGFFSGNDPNRKLLNLVKKMEVETVTLRQKPLGVISKGPVLSSSNATQLKR